MFVFLGAYSREYERLCPFGIFVRSSFHFVVHDPQVKRNKSARLCSCTPFTMILKSHIPGLKIFLSNKVQEEFAKAAILFVSQLCFFFNF